MPANKGLEVKVENPATLDPKKWVDRHADYLFKYAIVRIHNQDLVKDLVQETFLAGLNGLIGFAGKSTERTWLTAILKYKIIDIYRRESSGLASINEIEHEAAIQDDFFETANGHWKNEYLHKPFEQVQDPFHDKEFNKDFNKAGIRTQISFGELFGLPIIPTTEFVD